MCRETLPKEINFGFTYYKRDNVKKKETNLLNDAAKSFALGLLEKTPSSIPQVLVYNETTL